MVSTLTKNGKLSLPCILAMTPFAWIAFLFIFGTFFSFPQTDDFCAFGRLFHVHADNPFVDTWSMYLHWTGRYTSMFLIATVGWLASLVPWSMYLVYSIALTSLIIIFGIACLVATRVLTATGEKNLPIAAVTFATSLILMPSKLEGVFWLTGAIIYLTGVAGLLLLSRSITKDDTQVGRAPYSWATLALIVGCVGFNELLALSVGVLLVFRVLAYARNRTYLKRNIAYFATYLTAFAASILAPGNFVRDAGSPLYRHHVGAALGLATQSFNQFISMHISPNALFLSLIILGTFVAGWAQKPAGINRFSAMSPLPLTLVSGLPLHLVVYSFLTGEEAPGRVINQSYVMALIGLCLLAGWMGMRLASTSRRTGNLRLAHASLLVLGILCVSSLQFRQVVSVVRDFGPIWRAQQIERTEILKSAKERSVLLASFTPEGSTPPVLQGSDITDDPTYWVNMCLSGLYGVKDIRLTKPESVSTKSPAQ
jgi:hypothetical protein